MFSWLRRLFGGGGEQHQRAASPTVENNPYHGLRQQALTTPRQQEQGSVAGTSTEPRTAMMEIGYEGATVTVVAFEDGTTSIYLSSGGGFIGGGEHETIRAAGQTFIATAGQFVSQMTLATEFPEPKLGETIFYARTDAGTIAARPPAPAPPSHGAIPPARTKSPACAEKASRE